MSLSLVSLNVERSMHVQEVHKFLLERKPDVLCVQELSEKNLPFFEQLFPEKSEYVPFSRAREFSGDEEPQGVCIFSMLPIMSSVVRYYAGKKEEVPVSDIRDESTYPNASRAVVFVEVGKDGESFRIGTTHFTWSPRGEVTSLQREHFTKLLSILGQEQEFVFSGDLNTPRGGELFTELSKRYKDNIPVHYKTSIDVSRHRAGATDAAGLSTKMVDCLFTTPAYVVSDVELVSGISDHCAVVATVIKQR